MGEPATSLYVPEDGKVAIRDPDGSVWKIPQAQLPEAQHQGARPATEAEYFGAQAGKGGEIAAATTGAARGISFGLSDPLYVEGARALGGDQNAEDVRDTLRLLKQSSPNASLGGEVAGALAPLAVGAPPVEAAELGGSAALRFGTRALAAAPRAVGEGVAMGLGGQLSEDTLANHKMTAESYLSAGVKGGALGLLLGSGGAGLLGAAGDHLAPLFGRGERGALEAGEGATSRLARAEEGGPYRAAGTRAEEAATGERKGVMDWLEGQRDLATYKSTGANRTDVKNLGKAAEDQAQRMEDISGRLRSETYEGQPLVSPTASEREINRRINGRANEVGKELGAMRAKLDETAERPSMSAIAQRFEAEVAPDALGHLGGEQAVANVRAKLAEMTKLGGETPSFKTLHTLRRDLEPLSKYSQVAPKAETEMYRALRNLTEEEFTAAGERAAKSIGEHFADSYRLQKSLYSDLAAARDASNRAVGRGTGNNKVSLRDIGAAVTGAVVAGPAGLAAAGGSMIARGYGHQIASHVLDAATKMQSLQRLSGKLDALLSDGTKAFVSGSKAASRAVKPVTTAEVRAIREATRSPDAITARIAEHLGDLPKYAPKVAQEIATTASRAAAWAQHALPKETAPIGPVFSRPVQAPLSDTQLLEARATIETLEDGSIVVDRLRQGRLTPGHVAALKYVHPETFATIQRYLAQHATELGKSLSQQQLFSLSMLFGEPLTEAALPENVRAFQASFTQGNQAPGAGGAGGNTGGAAPMGGAATGFDKLEAGH